MAKKKPVDPAIEASSAPEKAVKHSDYDYVIKNKKARNLTKHKKAIIISGIVLLLLLLLVGVFYGFYAAVEVNNFRIYIDRSGSKVLSLSMNPTMEPASELIEIVGPSKMTNTTLASGKNIAGGTAIEEKILDIIAAEGSFTSVDDYFIAGTFYIKNLTTETKNFTEMLKFEECSNGTARALRVMVIRDYDITVYAYPQTEGTTPNGELLLDEENNPIPEQVVPRQNYVERYLEKNEAGEYELKKSAENNVWTCENFYCDDGDSYENYAIYNTGNTIVPGQVIAYSIVIWFEGWDAQCRDDILDGVVKLNLSFACD